MQFCSHPGCHELAVGVGYWQGRRGTENPHPRRPNDRCRAHLLAHIDATGPAMVRCEVTVTVPDTAIACARTGQDILQGGVVELDPVETNIATLVGLGYVKVLPAEAPAVKAEAKKA